MLFHKESNNPEYIQEPVSVIICARNEETRLQKTLPPILEQEYPNYEVIVVNDDSEDNTNKFLTELKKHYSHLRILDHKKTQEGKKEALEAGVKFASNENIIVTDADCKPQTNKWLYKMSAGLAKKNLVLGYGGHPSINTLTGLLSRFDAFYVAFQYVNYALSGLSYMGTGRNMGYSKNEFLRKDPFKGDKTASGDDDLLVQKLRINPTICISKECHTISPPPLTIKQWCKRKMRHFTTSTSYTPLYRVLLTLYPLSLNIFWVCTFILLYRGATNIQLILFIFFIRMSIQIITFKAASEFLQEKWVVYVAPVLEFLLINLYSVLYLWVPFTNKSLWQTN
ncbi:MAG: glycosyltransferase [Flavobacteriales bacterium]